MKPLTKQTVKTASKFVTIGLLICLLIGAFIAYGQSPTSTFTISSGIYPGAPSYTIWVEGSEYFAKDANGLLAYSGTNASNIIQSLITITSNGVLYCKSGTFSLDTTLVITKGKCVQLKGEADFNDVGAEGLSGMHGTKFVFTNAVNGINITGTGVGVDSVQGVLVSDIWIYGTNKTNGKAGIYLDYTDQVRIERVSISNFEYGIYGYHLDADRILNSWLCYNGYGIYLEIPLYTKILNNEISDNSYNGISIIRPSPASYSFVSIKDNGLKTNGLNGIELNYTMGNTLSGNVIQQSTRNGIMLNYAYYNQIVGNIIVENTRNGIVVQSASDNNVMDANEIRDNDYSNTATYDGIQINAGDNTISNSRIFDNDRYGVYVIAGNRTNILGVNTYGTAQVAGIRDSGTNTHVTASWNSSTWIATYP